MFSSDEDVSHQAERRMKLSTCILLYFILYHLSIFMYQITKSFLFLIVMI